MTIKKAFIDEIIELSSQNNILRVDVESATNSFSEEAQNLENELSKFKI